MRNSAKTGSVVNPYTTDFIHFLRLFILTGLSINDERVQKLFEKVNVLNSKFNPFNFKSMQTLRCYKKIEIYFIYMWKEYVSTLFQVVWVFFLFLYYYYRVLRHLALDSQTILKLISNYMLLGENWLENRQSSFVFSCDHMYLNEIYNCETIYDRI